MILTPQLLAEFDEQGFVVLQDFFSCGLIDSVREAIDRHMDEIERSNPEEGGRHRPGHGMLVGDQLAERDPQLLQFCSNPELLDVIMQLAGPQVRLYCNQAIYKPPEDPRAMAWHQDNGYTPVKPDQYYTCWIPLVDATVENGCIWVMPSTHRNGIVPHVASPVGKSAYQGDEQGIPVPVKAGSLILFSSLLIHRSSANTSRHVRKAYVVQYIPANAGHGVTGKPFTDRLLVAKAGRPVKA
jgi:ectoine hydroxylase-related dioxygenase (phytanoyl-CoA dioxygenase family)